MCLARNSWARLFSSRESWGCSSTSFCDERCCESHCHLNFLSLTGGLVCLLPRLALFPFKVQEFRNVPFGVVSPHTCHVLAVCSSRPCSWVMTLRICSVSSLLFSSVEAPIVWVLSLLCLIYVCCVYLFVPFSSFSFKSFFSCALSCKEFYIVFICTCIPYS